uniref:Late embryogenesis abundant protein LEA-2 subgroup domain-containing protein n=1 Tax=Kwoniella bestiolae CBS 10118 TaxID=1296100 RepID=A0A1B9FUN7_9TREE|nr:hypothetical protein I302_08123 [Kwoniella bestiolae CBS 10118]OCF22474.1 hypothetical protein I302_08123 [Kwoniella bestiolae CBS 10118]
MSHQYGNSYADPYNQQQGYYNNGYDESQQPPPFQNQGYSYSNDANPYGEEPRYPSYPADPSAGDYQPNSSTEKMNDEGQYQESTQRAQPGRSGLRRPPVSIAEMGPPPRSTGILRMWRKDERGKQWSRYVRPPSFALNSVNLGSSPVSLTTNGLTVSFDLSISVANPNWFNADFKEITATAQYPGNNTNTFGGGTLYNLNFVGYTQSTFDFPFTLNYTLAKDPNQVILKDLISKCGISGGAKKDITVDYDLYLKLKILGVTVSPTISNSASFECPITASDIQAVTPCLD